jgi:hypothetical protein
LQVKRAALAAAAMSVVVAASLSIPVAFADSSLSTHRHHVAQAQGAAGPVATTVAAAEPAWTPLQGSFHNPFAAAPQLLAWPKIAPYPPGQGDADGLSGRVEECNKGCVDN